MKKIRISKCEKMVVDIFALDLLIAFTPQEKDSEFVKVAKLWAGDVVNKKLVEVKRKFVAEK